MARKYAPKYLLLCLLLGSVRYATAQVRVQARLDSTHMYIGDQQNLYLQILVSPQVQVQKADIQHMLPPPLEVVEQSPWDTTTQGRSLVLDKTLRFTAWDSGTVIIPRIPVVFQYREQRDTSWSAPLTLEIALVLPDTSGLAPIKPIIVEPARWTDYLPWLISAAIALVIGLALWWYQRKDRPAAIPHAPPPIPPYQQALAALQQLDQRKLWQQGQVKDYYYELSYILRAYLEARFGILALESTTAQIIAALREKDVLNSQQLEWLQHALHLADMVKFAKAEPPPTTHAALLSQAIAFVNETKSQPPTQKAEGNE